jgi:hypothetical protein
MTPHPAFGTPLPVGEGLGVREIWFLGYWLMPIGCIFQSSVTSSKSSRGPPQEGHLSGGWGLSHKNPQCRHFHTISIHIFLLLFEHTRGCNYDYKPWFPQVTGFGG